MLELLRKGVASLFLGLGIILISLAVKIDPDQVESKLFTIMD